MSNIAIVQSTKFKRDIKRVQKRGKPIHKLQDFIKIRLSGKRVPVKYRDHELTGNWIGYRECHIEPDWLLIYTINSQEMHLVRTGSHSDLF